MGKSRTKKGGSGPRSSLSLALKLHTVFICVLGEKGRRRCVDFFGVGGGGKGFRAGRRVKGRSFSQNFGSELRGRAPKWGAFAC